MIHDPGIAGYSASSLPCKLHSNVKWQALLMIFIVEGTEVLTDSLAQGHRSLEAGVRTQVCLVLKSHLFSTPSDHQKPADLELSPTGSSSVHLTTNAC